MNNELRSPTDGVVETVPVKPGQRVKAGDLLVALRRQ
jgi:biotin carboxyl carrier protein